MEVCMKAVKKIVYILAALLIFIFTVSCASTGEYMPLKSDETVIGTVQTTFLVQSSFFFMKSVKNTINKQAYVRLMETAGQKYSGSIDLGDIIWVTGNSSSDKTQTEIFATGKVVRID
jgi:lysyl-tRNA synthetase class II